MSSLELLRFLHVLGATLLIGNGIGIAYFFFMANRSGDPHLIAGVGRIVVIADTIFTATAVVVQPVTGALLIEETGWAWTEPWVLLSLGLYLFIGLCWLPVVAIQIRLRDLAAEAAMRQEPLPPRYRRLYRCWLLLGIPAFSAILVILWLMLTRPAI